MMNRVEISPERLAVLDAAHLASGSGSVKDGSACLINFANFLAGGDGATDSHPCIDRGIQRFCIRINDSPRFAEWRDELKPYAARVLNTASTPEVTQKRGYMYADWAVRTAAPRAFDFWAEVVPARADEARAWAEKLRATGAIVDEPSAKVGRELAQGARKIASWSAPYAAAYDAADTAAAAATYAADTAAYAATYAAAAAYAAYAAAAAAAAAAATYAADTAAYAADTAAYAAVRSKDAAFSRELFTESLRFLDRIIEVTSNA